MTEVIEDWLDVLCEASDRAIMYYNNSLLARMKASLDEGSMPEGFKLKAVFTDDGKLTYRDPPHIYLTLERYVELITAKQSVGHPDKRNRHARRKAKRLGR